jgi:hypothetical protein
MYGSVIMWVAHLKNVILRGEATAEQSTHFPMQYVTEETSVVTCDLDSSRKGRERERERKRERKDSEYCREIEVHTTMAGQCKYEREKPGSISEANFFVLSLQQTLASQQEIFFVIFLEAFSALRTQASKLSRR